MQVILDKGEIVPPEEVAKEVEIFDAKEMEGLSLRVSSSNFHQGGFML